MAEKVRRILLEEILSREQIHHVLCQSIGENVRWELKSSDVNPAMDGIAGFLSEHMRAILHVEVQGELKDVHLFWKCLPVDNKAKADFIDGQNYFGREALVYRLMEEMSDDDPARFSVRAYIYTDSIIVMPDVTFQGYACRPYRDTLDPAHVFVTTTSIARFHAAFVNYETNKRIYLKRPYSIFQEFGHLLTEPIFCDSPWLKAAAKLSTNLLKTFSRKSYRDLPDLETKLFNKYLEACDSLTEYKDTVNTLLHRDLWINNIMFKYENEVPINAIIIDFQNLRYGPPAFDLMTFLYFTTDKGFREAHEIDVFNHYYSIFTDNLNVSSKRRLISLGYDREAFFKWCEKGRMFGMIEAIGLFPYVLLDPKTAEKTFNFDDLETHEKNFNEDRSEMILAYCLKCEIFKRRNLNACEEFVETYLLTQPT